MQELLTQWAQLQRQIDELKSKQVEIESQVKPFVLENKATVEAEGAKAEYKKGRSSCDYESAALAVGVPDGIVETHTQVKSTTSWAKVCKDAGIKGDALLPYRKVGKPSVSIKLI